VTSVLENVCPNCGGGFTPRPVRPAEEWVSGEYLGAHPASRVVRHRPVDATRHATLLNRLRAVPPHER
jgi:hypothetical protein